MFEKEILQLLHDLNTENLDIKNKIGFSDFFKSILKSSYIFIKLGYNLLFLVLYINIFFLNIFFLSKNKKFTYFKYLTKFLGKVFIFRDVLKFIKIYSIIYCYD